MMRPASRRFHAIFCFLGSLGLCGMACGALIDHVEWGQIVHGRVYDDPTLGPLYVVLIEFETDASVEAIEIVTPGGYYDVIPSDEYTVYAGTETFHRVSGLTDRWEYWGYFEDPEALDAYGDGLYVFTVHYTDGSAEETSLWYAMPGTNEPIPAPVQRPHVTWPSYDGVAASPVTFLWEPITDPYVAEIYLGVVDASGAYAGEGAYSVDSVISDPYPLAEGLYDVELSLENFYPIANEDGIPFDLLKTSILFQPFEVMFSRVYRFWCPMTGVHFYTVDEDEKNILLREHRDTWAYEGLAFHAWATKSDPNLSPVYRLHSRASGSYFYTLDEAERDRLVHTYPDVWEFEGVAFYAFEKGRQPPWTKPVYRFWNRSNGSHFYSIDQVEVDGLLANYAHLFVFEGPAFYACGEESISANRVVEAEVGGDQDPIVLEDDADV